MPAIRVGFGVVALEDRLAIVRETAQAMHDRFGFFFFEPRAIWMAEQTHRMVQRVVDRRRVRLAADEVTRFAHGQVQRRHEVETRRASGGVATNLGVGLVCVVAMVGDVDHRHHVDECAARDLLDQGSNRILIGPDLLIAFAFAWSLRRPEYVPSLLLALVFLLADLLLQRPPGLWAMLALLACENLKGRSRSLRDATFGAEWIAVAVMLAGILIINRIVLSLVLVPAPQLKLSLLELGVTILIYPVVVLITRTVMGVRRAAPGELDTLGGRG